MGNTNTPMHKDSEVCTMVVAGGNKNSVTGTSEREDGSCPLFDPLRWSQQDVNIEDQWFSGLSITPSAFGQNGMMSPPDPGSIAYVLREKGKPGGVIIGISNTVRKGGEGASGGQDFMNGPIMQQLKDEKIPVNIPPKIKETTERGAKIRKIEEKGEEHSLGLLDGLPIHGALFQMTGFKLPELKNIPTAKQTNDKMMNNQMMQQLAGQVMSMAQMFQGLMNNKGSGGGNQTMMQQINSQLSPQMQTAVGSLSKLVQGLDTSDGVSFVTGSVVHEETFLNNSANLLSQVTTVSDLMNTMQRLQSDTSLHGLDKLKPVEYVIETAHGAAKQIVDFEGTIQVLYDANTMNNMNNWANVVSSNAYSPGAGSAPYQPPQQPSNNQGGSGGQGQQIQSMISNMFGQSSGVMQQMLKRLAPQQEKEAKKMHEKLNRGSTAKKLNTIFKETAEGGEPLKKDHYKTSSGAGVGGTTPEGDFGLQFLTE